MLSNKRKKNNIRNIFVLTIFVENKSHGRAIDQLNKIKERNHYQIV